jgi:preflagellin peptidase FlaK
MVILALASWVDLKTGEVPEKHSIGLAMVVALASIGCAVFYWNLDYVIQPLFAGLVAFAASYVIFYLGQWGGGDVKILGGIGGLLGFLQADGFAWPNNTFLGSAIPPLLTYTVNMAFIASPYVLVYTLFLGARQPRVFGVFLRRFLGRRVLFTFGVSLLPLIFAVYYRVFFLAYVYALVPAMVAASTYMKTVEDELMTKTIGVSELKEWDIIAEEVAVDGEQVAPKGNIEGVTPEQLARIKQLCAEGKIPQTIKTKWGVKFVPVLLLALPMTLYLGNMLEVVFQLAFDVH